MESYATVAPPGSRLPASTSPSSSRTTTIRTRLAVELAGAAQFETIEELVQQLRPGAPGRRGVRSRLRQSRWASSTCTGSRARTRELGVVFAVDELSTDVLQQALRAGARDAVVIGGEASLHQSVDRVGELLAGARDRAPAPTPATRHR